MKKNLLFFALFPVTLFAGEWSKQFVEADELLGNTTSYYKYVFQEGEDAFVFRTDKADQFYILSPNVLDCHNYSGRVGCMVKVGQQKKTRKIFKHLRGSDGYVRIVVDSYSHGLYDLRVTPCDKW